MLISSSNAFTADASDKLWELIQLINDQEDSYHLPPAEVSFLVLDKKIKLLLRCLDEGNISYVNLMEKVKLKKRPPMQRPQLSYNLHYQFGSSLQSFKDL